MHSGDGYEVVAYDNNIPIVRSKYTGKLIRLSDGYYGTEKQEKCARFWDIIGLKANPERWWALTLLALPLLCYVFTIIKMKTGIIEVSVLQVAFIISLLIKSSFLSIIIMLRPIKWKNKGWKGMWYLDGRGYFCLSTAGLLLVWLIVGGTIGALVVTFGIPPCGCES